MINDPGKTTVRLTQYHLIFVFHVNIYQDTLIAFPLGNLDLHLSIVKIMEIHKHAQMKLLKPKRCLPRRSLTSQKSFFFLPTSDRVIYPLLMDDR